MEKLEVILSLAGTALGFLVTAITLLLKFIKNEKTKKIAESTLKITDAVMPYIKQAESFFNYNGTEKKEFVMTKANQFAIENGVKFNAELVSKKIEEMINLTKKVNPREKDAKLPEPAEPAVSTEPIASEKSKMQAELTTPTGPAGFTGG